MCFVVTDLLNAALLYVDSCQFRQSDLSLHCPGFSLSDHCPAFYNLTIAVTSGMYDKAYWKYNASFLKSEKKKYNNFIHQNN